MDDKCCSNMPPREEDMRIDEIERNLVDDMLRSALRPEAVVEEVAVGPKFIGVIAGGRMGISSLLGARRAAGNQNIEKEATGQKASRIADYLLSPSPFDACLGMAALNAANAPDPAAITGDDAPADALIAELGRDRIVGIVGDFPFTDSLRKKVGTLHLFELREVPGAVPMERWEEALARCDVLAVTGTALLTRQMGFFLSRAERATTVVLGPTTPLSNALFRFGADYLCGSVFADPSRVMQGIRSGLSFRSIKKNGGVRFVTWRKDNGCL
ncbi:MAG: hypothetical protein JW807_10990 [Spirochaetes bacterium]|nr:hypothetical protein [Spirochaetota bacterium]